MTFEPSSPTSLHSGATSHWRQSSSTRCSAWAVFPTREFAFSAQHTMIQIHKQLASVLSSKSGPLYKIPAFV